MPLSVLVGSCRDYSEGLNKMKTKVQLAGTVVALLLLFSLPGQSQSAPTKLTVSGFVQNQMCINNDFVKVTLSATADSDSHPVGFRWDLNNDGKADTKLSTDPTVVHV